MAKCNSTKNNRNGLKVFAIIVSILLVVCLVASLCVIGRTTNGFKEIPEFDDEVEEDTFVVDPEDDDEANISDEPSGVKLFAEKIPEEDYEIIGLSSETIGAYTVTASFEPSNADIKEFSWSLALDTTWSGYNSNGDYTDYYGTVWSSSSTFKMSDYITLSGDDTLSCTVSCNELFGCPVILTFEVSDFYGNSFSSFCSLNCQCRYDSLGVSLQFYSEDFSFVYDSYNNYQLETSPNVYYIDESNFLSYSDGVLSSSVDSLSLSSRFFSYYMQVEIDYENFDQLGLAYLNFYDFNGFTLDEYAVTNSYFDPSSYSISDFGVYSDYLRFYDLMFDVSSFSGSVFSVGTLPTTLSFDDYFSSLSPSLSVRSGIDDSVLASYDSICSFDLLDSLTKLVISDSKCLCYTSVCIWYSSVYNNSSVRQALISLDSSPLLYFDFSVGGSTVSIPFYVTDLDLLYVSLTGASVSSSDIVFN